MDAPHQVDGDGRRWRRDAVGAHGGEIDGRDDGGAEEPIRRNRITEETKNLLIRAHMNGEDYFETARVGHR